MPGNDPYKILYVKSVIANDIPSLTPEIRRRIQKAIESKLTLDPISYGKPMQYSLKGNRRLRVGDYRVIYTIDFENHTIIVTAIAHRKNVYADA